MLQYQKILIVIVFLFCSCKKDYRTLPYYNSPDFTPIWENTNHNDYHKIRPFNLVDQHGNRFTEQDLDNNICVVDFFFTSCPGICPKMTQNMYELQEHFKDNKEVLLVSHSVTPETDDVNTLTKYAKLKKVNYSKWKLLTGNKNEIYDLGRRFYFVEEDLGLQRDTTVFLHTENFILIDKKRRIRGIYNGIDKASMLSLIADIKCLQEEGNWFF